MHSTGHHHHQQQQQHQQHDYTALWARDLIARRSHTSPNSSSSTNPLNPIAVHDRMVVDRRRWTCCVCVGFLVCLLVNIASLAFVIVTVRSADDLVDSALFQQFMSQDGSAEALNRINIWKNYLNLGNGTSPHKSAEPIAIHFKLGPVKSSDEEREGPVTGWTHTKTTYLRGVKHEKSSGAFHIEQSGVYQVYSQLSFTCPANKSIVDFKQELKDDSTGQLLLDDVESINCSDMPARLPSHVSFMMSVLQLQQGYSLRLYTNRLELLSKLRNKKLSFFGILKLN